MKSREAYNAVVIGAGTAGLVTAAGTAALGGRVALVERGRMGGDCLNTGCVPSKALIASARLIDDIRHASRWGLRDQDPRFDFEEVFARMRSRRAAIAPNDSRERFESLGVDVLEGTARFVSPRQAAVNGNLLCARNFVIATGSRPRVPPIEGLAAVPHYTNETVFDELKEKPDRLVIVGAGPIGCELGQIFTRLGVKVTLIHKSPQILEKEDADAAGLVRSRLEAEGVRVLVNAEVRRVTSAGAGARVEIAEAEGEVRTVEADALLIAAGRAPNVENLGLEAAGVAVNRSGIAVDRSLRTSQKHIFAAGDVVGSLQFTHVADAHARTVVRNILLPWFPARFDDSVVPWCTYTSPEVARVGLNEDQARQRGIAYDVFTQPIEELDRAVVESRETGFAKVLVEKGTDRILGATIVAEHAGEILHELVLAMKAGVGLKQIAATIHAYPTFAEAARKLADRHQRSRLTPGVHRVFRWMYRARRRGVS